MNSTGLRHICIVRSVVVTALRMSSSSYEDAIRKLNSLQSNKSTIEQIKKQLKTGQRCTNLDDMQNYLQRIGIPLTKLDELSVIHVAGTKGKGSTSAMCESILRHHGFRTGFYSSPHLVAARERIRLAGRPLAEQTFANYLHKVYDMLEDTQEFPGDMPKYFAFLTVMAYYVFLQERVNVAVIEVGIGGVVDYTNVLRKVPVVGITALGLDHTSILGNTIEEIAWAKAGIMKRGCDAYTVRQPTNAIRVLDAVAHDVKCPITVVPDYNSYTFPESENTHLPVDLDAYKINASLAIQLAHAWMRKTHSKTSSNSLVSLMNKGRNGLDMLGKLVYELPYETMEGLRQCKWPGRYHKIQGEYADFYLDGAHTKESMEICADWFKDGSTRISNKILIFSATGDRNAEILLHPLFNIPFKSIYFVIPTAHRATSQNNDNYSLIEHEELVQRCRKHAQIWLKINGQADVKVLECVSDALVNIKQSYVDKAEVLITGSLHLVGAALSILDPNLST